MHLDSSSSSSSDKHHHRVAYTHQDKAASLNGSVAEQNREQITDDHSAIQT
jgi:hypothetical protein